MRCKRCGQEMKIKSVEVGKDAKGNSIYNDYGFCYECKIKINLDKRKAKVGKTEAAKEDLSLTRQFEAQVEQLVEKDTEEEAVSQKYIKEQTKRTGKKPERDSEKMPPKKRPEQSKKRKPNNMPEKRVKDQPEKPRRESRRQREIDFDSIPEKRVKEVRTKEKPRKKKGKGIIKFIVFILIVAAIGAAVYFNRDTVKGWIHIGLEKFDSMSDNKDDKEDDANSDITDGKNTDADSVGEKDTVDGAGTTDGVDEAGSSDTEGTTDTTDSTQTDGITNTEDNTTTTE